MEITSPAQALALFNKAKEMLNDIQRWLENNAADIASKAKKIFTKDDFRFIDLGLPSGTLWAKDYAPGYYAFDEAQEAFPGLLPTAKMFQELYDHCKWEWLSKSKSPGKKCAGYRVTGPNGKSIFFPALGYKLNDEIFLVGNDGYWWSACAGSGFYGQYLRFDSGYVNSLSSPSRFCGCSVRPALVAVP